MAGALLVAVLPPLLAWGQAGGGGDAASTGLDSQRVEVLSPGLSCLAAAPLLPSFAKQASCALACSPTNPACTQPLLCNS